MCLSFVIFSTSKSTDDKSAPKPHTKKTIEVIENENMKMFADFQNELDELGSSTGTWKERYDQAIHYIHTICEEHGNYMTYLHHCESNFGSSHQDSIYDVQSLCLYGKW